MIVYVSTAAHQYTVRTLLETRPTLLDGELIVLSYEELLSWATLPIASYLFTDIDRLTPAQRRRVLDRVPALRAALPEGCRILNDPARCLGRLALLQALESAGINDYRARPVGDHSGDDIDSLRYPVFVRVENDHAGAQTPLIDSREALLQALKQLREQGLPEAQCVIIEYIDVRNAAGLFEKFSVFRVGDAYFSAEHSVHTGWICKGNDGEFWSPEWGQRELQFQSQNPHVELLKPVFEVAGIEYGRADYAFSQGRLQVFEINTNPMLDCQLTAEPLRRAAQDQFLAAYLRACSTLAKCCAVTGSVRVPEESGKEVVEGGSRLRNVLRSGLRITGLLQHEGQLLRHVHGRR